MYARERKQKLTSILLLQEECTGYICAKYFPRCFYVNETHQGGFEFEVCRETCEVKWMREADRQRHSLLVVVDSTHWSSM